MARVAVNRCRDLLTSPGAGGGRTTTRPLERLTFETPWRRPACFAALGALSPDSRALLHLRLTTRGSRWRAGPPVPHHRPGALRPALPGQTTTQEEAGGTRL